MEDLTLGHGTSEEEIFEELNIRHELEPIGSYDEYAEAIDEIIEEKISFGELHADDDIEGLKDKLLRRYDDFKLINSTGEDEI